MSVFRVLASLSVAGLFGVSAALAGPPQRPIVVELYTSQGCSSCPPADAILGRLADRPGIIAISLPITYWDMLGWKDTLASEANTRRQKAYAAAMGHGGVYTPQIIVDGVSDVVGSRAGNIDLAIAERRAQLMQAQAMAARDDAERVREAVRAVPAALAVAPAPPTSPVDPIVPVTVIETPDEVRVDVGAAQGIGNATIWMLHLRSSVSVSIARGENSGHTLTYRNVAADLKPIGVYKGKPLSLSLPRAAANGVPHDGVVVIVQKGGYGHVLGAAYLGRVDYYAQQ
jgi:hypothetical protein